MARLNRRRKASGEREADRERGKKICLERSVAKTLLTLHRHSGKSKEEHAAAGALLDLTLEPVASTGQPDDEADEGMHEFEAHTAEFPEPIELDRESEICTRDTQTDEKLLRECSTQVSKFTIKTRYIFS